MFLLEVVGFNWSFQGLAGNVWDSRRQPCIGHIIFALQPSEDQALNRIQILEDTARDVAHEMEGFVKLLESMMSTVERNLFSLIL